ncbi:hypothetical protein BDK88_2941 [Natrinema hispanicum]|uniref:DUF2064 domain-containing protein n=1 Tax=Natrinema hispanicum TaxID=392421 RepID=A0A482Y9Z7_9EURY|nr:DUF2064 domain-containing protein [Natrinema hispanicum]RZV08864.1 hypothetical protein BDK88_2941 [Natrinema hispanicum]
MIVVVPVAPPREGLVLSSLVEQSPLSAAEAVSLYEVAVADVLWAVASSGGDLLVNYRDADTLPDAHADGDPEAEVRALVLDALGEDAEVRFERQVGSSRAARVGNTVTHLLEREGADSVGVLEPTAPLVARTEIDGAAMSLRRHNVVLGPAERGGTYFAGFAEPIDFTDAYATPELSTLAQQATDDGLGVGFAPMLSTVATPTGLQATIAGLEARQAADRPGAEATAALIDDLGIAVGADGDLERV